MGKISDMSTPAFNKRNYKQIVDEAMLSKGFSSGCIPAFIVKHKLVKRRSKSSQFSLMKFKEANSSRARGEDSQPADQPEESKLGD